jgi:hypothetical protein
MAGKERRRSCGGSREATWRSHRGVWREGIASEKGEDEKK